MTLIIFIIAIYTFLVLASRLIAPLYLEGKMIRNLIANNGRLPVDVFEKHFKMMGFMMWGTRRIRFKI